MKSHLATIKLFLLLTLVTGLLYPAAVCGFAALYFPQAANGSLIIDSQGVVRGSFLVGQNFEGPGVFWGRPSQTAEHPYHVMAASGGNLGTSNPALKEVATERLQQLTFTEKVPMDLVTSSGSGLDPHISPEAARLQVQRVSMATGLSPEVLERLIVGRTEAPTLGIMGQPRVNVVGLNFDLARVLNEKP